MSKASNNQGRGYEFACLVELNKAINKIRPAEIIVNSSYVASRNAWNTITQAQQLLYTLSAQSTIDTIFALEPNIVEETNDILNLYIQQDKKGEDGDVRDIIIERNDIKWEIGLSVKHNHFAVKHSRLSNVLDFGEKWYGIKCSDDYWKNVRPVFEKLEFEKQKGTFFRDLKSKEDDVYVPLLNAFMSEIGCHLNNNPKLPQRLVEYLLSKYDFYKVISIDSKKITTIQSFNMYGTLNKSSRVKSPDINVSRIKLPQKLLHIGFKPNSKTTVLMCFDNGWQFSFRIHNAKDIVEPSLKFDVQIIGMPTEVNIKFDCKWKR